MFVWCDLDHLLAFYEHFCVCFFLFLFVFFLFVFFVFFFLLGDLNLCKMTKFFCRGNIHKITSN